MRRKEERAKEQYDIDGLAVDGWRDGGGRSGVERDRETDIFGGVKEDEGEKEESRDVFRTTSFTDMARRRKRNSGFGSNVSLASDPYYSTGNTNTSNNVNFETFKYSPVLSETPPPPPPRPLPPVPPTLPPLKVCTLLANSLRPERFDWLMAFSPDGETLTPPLEVRKSNEETLKKSTSGSTSSSGSTSGSGSKVMTFKELRNRSKHSSPAYQLITEPDPDPTVITPDPDFLYNLKWRREKTDSDGIQWEYTSQAQATFLQPPPLTSLAAFREMFQKAEDAIGQPELCPSQQIGCSASEGNLWRMDGQRKEEGEKRKEEVEEEEVEVRGTADGGRTWESRTTVSSPPLSLAHSQPSSYFLHSVIPPYRPGYCGAHTRPVPRTQPHSHTETQSTATAPNPYTTQSTATAPNPYTTQSTATAPNPYTTQSTATAPNPYTTQSTATAPNPYTTQSTATAPNPYTTQLSNPFATPYTHTDLNEDSHGTYSKNDIDSGYSYSDYFKKDGGLDSARRFGKDFKSNIDSLYRYVNDSKTKEKLEYGFGSESITNFDSLYCTANATDKQPHTGSHTLVSNDTHTQGCTTPYKNVDAMMMAYAKTHTVGSLGCTDTHTYTSGPGQSRTSKDLPPLPSWYLYHPKNCPIHRGAPPRLSPIGALDPPHRSGAPPPGLDASCLSSPLFPRSHTLHALAAPLYYPFLYPPIPPRKTSDPPKLIQAPPLPPALTVRSVSFAGSVQRGGTSWMGDDVKAPLRGLGLSSLCLLEKRALVSAVSVAVEAILAQFSSSRTLVQKALSGDSSVNPSLGRLVLQCLCPALRSLLSDGLKPHQSDLISGRRPNSAWGLVQASTRPGRNSGAQYRGPSTQSLYSLQARIGELPQLRQNKHRFNAFLLGLLNIKLMDFWLSHLQSCSDVLVTFYRPSSFMRLSLTSCQPLFEELLLLLQPLSLLTLNLDLLFQHHHLEPANHSPEIPSPPNQDLGFRRSPRGSASQGRGSSNLESLSELYFGRAEPEATNRNASSSSLANSGVGGLVESLKPESLSVGPAKVSGGLAETSPQLMWVQEKGMMELAPPNVEEASLSQQAGQVIQQGWGAVVRWGGKLGQNLAELSLSAVQNQEGTSRDPPEPQASTQAWSDPPQVVGALAVPWGLGRLFGASNNPTIPTLPTRCAGVCVRVCVIEFSDTRQLKYLTLITDVSLSLPRRPSQWLSPGVSVLTRMVSSSSSANQRRVLEPQQVEEVVEREMEETWDNPRPLRYWKYVEIYLDYMFSLFSSVVMTVYDGVTSFL
uniref:RUN and SH3 domain-containing protein 1-like n=1 Tax=Salmo trutta TaxID=8032 RepID=A0A674CSA6_SALTR